MCTREEIKVSSGKRHNVIFVKKKEENTYHVSCMYVWWCSICKCHHRFLTASIHVQTISFPNDLINIFFFMMCKCKRCVRACFHLMIYFFLSSLCIWMISEKRKQNTIKSSSLFCWYFILAKYQRSRHTARFSFFFHKIEWDEKKCQCNNSRKKRKIGDFQAQCSLNWCHFIPSVDADCYYFKHHKCKMLTDTHTHTL